MSFFVGIIEDIYSKNNIPPHEAKLEKCNSKNSIIIIGDSRAKLGLVPAVFAENNKYQGAYNIAGAGASINYQIENVITGFTNCLIIIAVSPASVIGRFADADWETKDIREPGLYERIMKMGRNIQGKIENRLMYKIENTFKFPYGFQGIMELIFYGTTSEFANSFGWTSKKLFGSDVNYNQGVNYYYYNTKLLNIDQKYYKKNIGRFETNITQLRKDNYIVLVRLPIDKKLKDLENAKCPDFDDVCEQIAGKNNILYIKSLPNFEYDNKNSDFSHLSREQAIKFSELVNGIIVKQIINN